MQTWSIVIFGMNEAHTIGSVVTHAHCVLQKISSPGGEIIVVDDGSTDESLQVVKQLASKIFELKIITHQTNKGIGAALISGYNLASSENICAIPADGQYDLDQLLGYPEVETNTILSFCRYKNKIYSPFRKFLSWCNRQLLKYVFKVAIQDINWVKVYKRENLKGINFELSSSLVESEICIKLMKSGVKLIEVPAIYLQRQYGEPKGASPKIMAKALVELPKLFFSVRRFLSVSKK